MMMTLRERTQTTYAMCVDDTDDEATTCSEYVPDEEESEASSSECEDAMNTPKYSDKPIQRLDYPRKQNTYNIAPNKKHISRCFFSRIILMNADKLKNPVYQEIDCTIKNPYYAGDKSSTTINKYGFMELMFPTNAPEYSPTDHNVYVNIMNVKKDDFAISEVWDKSYYSTDTLAMLSLASTKGNIVYTYVYPKRCYSYWLKVPNFVFTEEDFNYVRKNRHYKTYKGDMYYNMNNKHFKRFKFILHTLQHTPSTYMWFKDECEHPFKSMRE